MKKIPQKKPAIQTAGPTKSQAETIKKGPSIEKGATSTINRAKKITDKIQKKLIKIVQHPLLKRSAEKSSEH